MRLPALLLLPCALARQLPLVIWHGLGDTYDSPGLTDLADLANSTHPGTQTHIISLSLDSSLDRRATFLGHVPTQINTTCQILSALPEPFSSGFNAIGFSQGGQFLRALVQTCPTLPPVNTLITFGSQHNGITQFLAECGTFDFACKAAKGALDAGKWSEWAQKNVVPAQYYRDPADLESYLEHSGWLADINNERKEKNSSYAERFGEVERVVLVGFKGDATVMPRESAWFADVVVGEKRDVQWVRDRRLWKEDWVGLKRVDDRDGLEFLEIEGEHMRFEEGVLEQFFEVYLGPHGKVGDVVRDGKKVTYPGPEKPKGQEGEL